MWPKRTRPATVRTAGWLAVAAIAVAGAIGCGGDGKATAHLQGTVTLDGKPLPNDATGSLIFQPVGGQGKPVTVPIDNDGNYDSPNTPMGQVRVTFNIQQPTGPEYTTDRGTKARDIKNIVPEKSLLGRDLEVTGDNSSQNFDL